MYSSEYDFKGMFPRSCEMIDIPKKDPSVISPRGWQIPAFERCKDHDAVIKAFCGSGKTVLAIMLAIYDALKHNRKQLFLVPQTHIGDGFLKHGDYDVPGIGKVGYCRPKNFCLDTSAKIEQLVMFLTSDVDNPKLNKLCGVATHHAFNAAINRIKKSKKLKLVKNICFYIDEAHHIKTRLEYRSNNHKETNQLGQNLNLLINQEKNMFRLLTATPYRADKGSLLPNKKFVSYNLDFIDHFKTLNIENVDVAFFEYKKDPINLLIENIKKEKDKSHYVVVPAKNSGWRKDKTALNRLIKRLKREFSVVLDLVEPTTQKRNKNVLLSQPKTHRSSQMINVVVTCKLGREGTDWCACDRIHHLSPEVFGTSLAVQTLGRLFRKFEGKTEVKAYYYVKEFKTLSDSVTKREFLSDRVNAMLFLMLIDDLFSPISFDAFVFEKDNKNKNKKRRKKKTINLRDVYTENSYHKIKSEILKNIFETDMKDVSVESVIRKAIKNSEMLIDVDDNIVVDAFKVLVLRAKSQHLRKNHFNVSQLRKIGFDIVVSSNNLAGNFYLGKLDSDTMAKYKDLVNRSKWSQEECETMADLMIESLSQRKGSSLSEQDIPLINNFIDEFNTYHETYGSLDVLCFDSFCKNLKSAKKEFETNLRDFKKQVKQKVNEFNKILPQDFDMNFEKPSFLVTKIASFRMSA